MSDSEDPKVTAARKEFLEQMLGLARFWGNLKADSNITEGPMTPIERTEGLVFSMLVELDGGGSQYGGYSIATREPDEDGETIIGRVELNATASLHDEFSALRKKAIKG